MSARANRGRVVAARALIEIEAGGHAEDLLSASLPEGSDGRLAWHLTFGVLRNRARVDASLRPRLRQPLAALDAPVRAVLRLGAFEKLFSRTPDHAAVQQAVEVARQVGARRAVGLVNAVLRRVQLPARLSRPDSLDYPAWLVRRWDERYGTQAVDAWAERDRTVPPVCLVTRDVAALDALMGDDERRPARAGERVLDGTRLVAPQPVLPGIQEGLAWVQDPAAIAVADLLADAVGTGRVLDAAASPGGKSLRLWARGLEVTATDLPPRLERLRSSCERLQASIDVQPADWREPQPGLGDFDGVLLDAPCTGLGTTRRHPEIRWRREPADLASMATLQRQLLGNAAQRVRPGGALVYAVCSPEPEEGEQVVQALLDGGDFELVERLDTSPPTGDEDAHQAFLLRRVGA